MDRLTVWRLVIVGCVILGAGCGREPEARTYELTGQVLAVKPETREILVKHEDIPGFMPAMTMPYAVKDAALIRGARARRFDHGDTDGGADARASVGDHQDRVGAVTGRRANDDTARRRASSCSGPVPRCPTRR